MDLSFFYLSLSYRLITIYLTILHFACLLNKLTPTQSLDNLLPQEFIHYPLMFLQHNILPQAFIHYPKCFFSTLTQSLDNILPQAFIH